MGDIKASVTIDAPIDIVRKYLTYRYRIDSFQQASKDVKGYIPNYRLSEESDENDLYFSAAAYDPLSKKTVNMASWDWGYHLRTVSGNNTEVTIWYKWSRLVGLAGGGTIKHQAANELTETVLALEALALGLQTSKEKQN